MDHEAFRLGMEAFDRGDLVNAQAMMERAAKSGHPKACYFLALWASSGELASGAAGAAHWLCELQRLAESGDGYSQWELGQCYRFGDLVALDIHKANYWLVAAARNNWPDAQHHLGHFLETGQYGFEVDLAAANSWYERALALDHAETMYLYALRGLDDPLHLPAAIALLERAAAKGFPPAVEVLHRQTH